MYFDANEIASIIRLYGAKGPRRLVLAAGLLVTGKEAARRQQLAIEIAQKIAAQEAAVAVATTNSKKEPSDEASQVLAAEKKKLESLRAYAAKRHAAMLPVPADKLEFEFSCAVRRSVGCVDEECSLRRTKRAVKKLVALSGSFSDELRINADKGVGEVEAVI